MDETYISIREKGFEDIENAIKKIQLKEKETTLPIRTIITPLEKEILENLKKSGVDPIFWF